MKKGKEFETITTTTIHYKTHIPKRRLISQKSSDFQNEKIEIKEKKKNLTIDHANRMDILLNKMNEKRKRKILIKYIIKLTEIENEFLKQYFNKWKINIQNKNNNNKKRVKDEISIVKTTNKRIITYIKTHKEEEQTINIIETEESNNTKLKKDNSNLYIKHRATVPNFISSTKNTNQKISIYTEFDTIDNKTLNDRKTDYQTKNKKSKITEKVKTKYIKEETKKFTLPNPKKETTKEFSIIINPMQRTEQIDFVDLTLPSMAKIPKAPHKKKEGEKKEKTDTRNSRYNQYRNRSNLRTGYDVFSPTYKYRNKTIETENNENESINTENTIHVRKKLKFDRAISSFDNEECNTISLKNDTSIQNKDFGYKTFTFIPHRKINKGREVTITEERNRFKNDEEDITKFDNETGARRKYQRRIFSMERKEVETKSKTFVSISKVESKIKQFYLEKGCQREHYNDYSNFILCEEIVYKSHDAVPEKILNISTIKKPKKKVKGEQEKIEEEEEQRESIFVQKVIDYKNRERKYGNLFKSPIKYPMTPYKNELSVSILSPFSHTSKDFYKAKERRLNLFSPEQSYWERRERREKEIIETKEDIFIKNTQKVSKSFEIKKIIINIPKCPISETINYLKDIKNPYVKGKILDNINSPPNKEVIDKAILPDTRFYPKIYKSMKKTQKLIDFHMQFLKEVPHHTFKKIAPNKIYNIINDTNKKLILMKIYYIYAHYKNDKYFIKRTYWNKWKKKIRIFSVNNDNTIHLRNISGHCFSVEKIVVKEVRCGIHPDSMNYMDCLCLRARYCLKRLILRYYLLKIIDIRKYYLFKWYKIALRKIRPIYL